MEVDVENGWNIVELARKLLNAGAKETINSLDNISLDGDHELGRWDESYEVLLAGFTVLQRALQYGYSIELVRLLLESGADPNIFEKGRPQDHPLVLAKTLPSPHSDEMASLLRDYGASMPSPSSLPPLPSPTPPSMFPG